MDVWSCCIVESLNPPLSPFSCSSTHFSWSAAEEVYYKYKKSGKVYPDVGTTYRRWETIEREWMFLGQSMMHELYLNPKNEIILLSHLKLDYDSFFDPNKSDDEKIVCGCYFLIGLYVEYYQELNRLRILRNYIVRYDFVGKEDVLSQIDKVFYVQNLAQCLVEK